MSAAPTLTVEVPEVGTFVFRRRTLQDDIAILAKADRLLGGDADVAAGTYRLAQAAATLETLQVSAPEGWSVLQADATDPETFSRIGLVLKALEDAEGRFRRGRQPQSAGAGEGAGTLA